MRRKPPPAERPEYGHSTGRALCMLDVLNMDDAVPHSTNHNRSKHLQVLRQRHSRRNGDSGGDGAAARIGLHGCCTSMEPHLHDAILVDGVDGVDGVWTASNG